MLVTSSNGGTASCSWIYWERQLYLSFWILGCNLDNKAWFIYALSFPLLGGSPSSGAWAFSSLLEDNILFLTASRSTGRPILFWPHKKGSLPLIGGWTATVFRALTHFYQKRAPPGDLTTACRKPRQDNHSMPINIWWGPSPATHIFAINVPDIAMRLEHPYDVIALS